MDESTDISSVKNLSLVVRTCQNFEVSDQFFTLIPVANATADSMYKAITDLDITLNVFEFWKTHLTLTEGDDSLLYPKLATLVTNIFCLSHSSAAV